MSPEEMPLLKGTPPGGAAAPLAGTGAITPASGSGSGAGSAAGARGGRLPQNIGHRGYKAAFPENTMAAFHGAVAAGACAIETDLHLSRDGVVVLSHDATLKRCFGIESRIADCDWSYLRTLQTTQEPRQHMPRLADLLGWLAAHPQRLEPVWVLLDIKTDDDPEVLLPAIAEAIASVPVSAPGLRPWRERIVLGAWNENYINACRTYLPGFQLAYIGFSLLYARRFLSDDYADVHFNLFQPTLVGPVGARFRKEVRKRGRRLFVWTVNAEEWMEWAVRKGVDGVITDDVGRFREVCGRFGDEPQSHAPKAAADAVARHRRREPGGWLNAVRLYATAALLQAAAVVLSLLFWHRLSAKGNPKGKGKGTRQPHGKPVTAKT